MTTVLAVYEGGVLRPVQPLLLNEGETVEITVARSSCPAPPATAEEAERRIREAGTLQQWIDAANALAPAEDGYDLLEAVNENRHPSERSLIPPGSRRGGPMSAAIVLDAGPLSTLANPRHSPQTLASRQWLAALQVAGRRVLVAEIADYEVRRELLRANKSAGLANLDQLARQLEYLPLTTAAMRKAAELWAQIRQLGKLTAADPALDADVILAVQALTLGAPNVVVATTNVGHLVRFIPAEHWQNIPP